MPTEIDEPRAESIATAESQARAVVATMGDRGASSDATLASPLSAYGQVFTVRTEDGRAREIRPATTSIEAER